LLPTWISVDDVTYRLLTRRSIIIEIIIANQITRTSSPRILADLWPARPVWQSSRRMPGNAVSSVLSMCWSSPASRHVLLAEGPVWVRRRWPCTSRSPTRSSGSSSRPGP